MRKSKNCNFQTYLDADQFYQLFNFDLSWDNSCQKIFDKIGGLRILEISLSLQDYF